ncbi:MAG: hypothetical protein HY275_17140 [Gemmatimonadetes bacterium]|nr:hypothetical protein [Gemmatimonadota bacterium]
MNKRLAVALLVVASIVYACSPRSHASERSARHNSEATVSDGIEARVDVTTAPVVTFMLELTNRTGKVIELQFPSAQTHDFAVLDPSGRTVWKWSGDRMFTQVISTETIAKNAQLTFTEEWRDAKPGAYTLVATATSASHPVEERIAFTVR